VSLSPNRQRGRSSIFGCPRLLIQNIRGFLPHLEAVSYPIGTVVCYTKEKAARARS